MAHRSVEPRTELELPGSWQYMQTVLPHLALDEAAGYVMRAPPLIEEGLSLLEQIPEAAAYSIAWENDFDTKSGLRVAVHDLLWRRAEILRRVYSDESLRAGRSEWTARRVLVCALLIQARRLNEDWAICLQADANT